MYKEYLTYDDIQLVPSYSEIASRKNVNLKTNITERYEICIPFIAAPMDTVCEAEMYKALLEVGAVGCIHRFMSIEEQAKQIKDIVSSINDESVNTEIWYKNDIQNIPIIAAIGANGDYLERAAELFKEGVNIILIDVAHGHHINVKNAIIELRKILPFYVDIIAGNIATKEAAEDLQEWDANGLRAGIGGGSLCTTRTRTGFGVPNVTCLDEIISNSKIPVIADGGIRTSGDIAKALALGSSCVMLGSLLAGTKEAPGQMIEKPNGLYKRYRGAASLETKTVHGQEQRNVEGESTVIPFKGGVKFIIEGLLDGVKSALSYNGADSLSNFHPTIVRVTNAGQLKAKPHLLF